MAERTGIKVRSDIELIRVWAKFDSDSAYRGVFPQYLAGAHDAPVEGDYSTWRTADNHEVRTWRLMDGYITDKVDIGL